MNPSKRNKVFKEKEKVKKIFVMGDINHEVFVYNKLKKHNIKTAHLMDVSNETITMSTISGETLLDVYIHHEQQEKDMQEYFALWYDYMEKFYKALPTMIFDDVNFSNFIVSNNEIIAVDFENVRIGNQQEDIATFICYGLFYDPVLTAYKKQQLATFFKKYYKETTTKALWKQYLDTALANLNIRRNKQYEVDWSFLFD